ncbi:DgaE family pyridoxal phosphate-dependent ammonia lyase [Leifsonia kafniensis]|uniref:DgaE family pyridoxal phosphate-dependent ammonia lyase n=1 Tax=Leifsonia kafniensis TaxID=475957 RepID=A0ABP7KQJ5_9MICO
MSIYGTLGLEPAINSSGKMTALGGSVLSREVTDAMAAAGREHVVIADLMVEAGRWIADVVGTEDACVSSGASSGVAIAVASVIAGTSKPLIQGLPGRVGKPFEVVIQKGHSVDFGAPITQMIALGGGQAVEVGSVNRVDVSDIEGAIGPDTAAVMFVQSHHTVHKGMVSLAETIRVAHERGIPVILDAAAEDDLQRWAKSGADIVIFSGGKAIGGPTSGIVCGSRELMTAARAQYAGIARPMKVGKEQVMGLIAALTAFIGSDADAAAEGQAQRARMQAIATRLSLHPGIDAIVEQDDAGREIYRAVFTVRAESGTTAPLIARALAASRPPMYLRDNKAAAGQLALDPRPLTTKEESILLDRLDEILTEAAHA